MRTFAPFILLLSSAPLSAQQVVKIDSEPRCPNCRITIRTAASITSVEPAGQPLFPTDVVRRAGGGFAVGPTLKPGVVGVFSADGSLAAELGRFGSGPGEMKEVRSVAAWSGDSIAVIHDRNQVSIYGADLKFGRTFALQSNSFRTFDLTRLPNGQLAAVRNGTGGGEDYPLRLFSEIGEPGLGFGERSNFTHGLMYSAASVGERVWAANVHGYSIDEYALADGRWLARYQRELTWFPKEPEREADGLMPGVFDLVTRGSGQLWVLLVRPRPERPLPSARATRSTPEAAAPVQSGVGDYREMYEYVLELLDLEQSAVIARATLQDRVAKGFLDANHLLGYREDPETGALTMMVWRLDVVDKGR